LLLPSLALLNDLWKFTPLNNTWIKITTNSAPAARHSGVCWYDTKNSTAYLFGGFVNIAGSNQVNSLYRLLKNTFKVRVICGNMTPFRQIGLLFWERLQIIKGFIQIIDFSVLRIILEAAIIQLGYMTLQAISGCLADSEIELHIQVRSMLNDFMDILTYTNKWLMPVQLEDIWAFNIELGQWAWMGGNDTSTSALPGVYSDTPAQYSTEIHPGGRESAYVVMSENARDVFVFGGYGPYSPGYIGYMNDLWNARIFRDECSLNLADCSPLATCQDLAVGFSCMCQTGYQGTGHGVNGCNGELRKK